MRHVVHGLALDIVPELHPCGVIVLDRGLFEPGINLRIRSPV